MGGCMVSAFSGRRSYQIRKGAWRYGTVEQRSASPWRAERTYQKGHTPSCWEHHGNWEELSLWTDGGPGWMVKGGNLLAARRAGRRMLKR